MTEIEVVRSLALDAAKKIADLLNTPFHRERKKDKSLVTEADLVSDALIREGLRKAFPSDAILTEESGMAGPPGADRVWLVDPLDGTKAFARGVAGFSVMVGLLKGGRPELGVVVDPVEGHVYEAVRGGGAFHTVNGRKARLAVSDRGDWGDMRVVVSTGFPDKSRTELRKTLQGPWLEPINSVGIKSGLLVQQEADIYISHHPVHVWDTCAPHVIVEEAGGAFSGIDGRPLAYDLGGSPGFSHRGLILASNARRHPELVSLLEGIF